MVEKSEFKNRVIINLSTASVEIYSDTETLEKVVEIADKIAGKIRVSDSGGISKIYGKAVQ